MIFMMDVIKQAALDAIRSTLPMEALEATVVSPEPELAIQIKGDTRITIPKEMLIVNAQLLPHKREIKVDGTKIKFVDDEKVPWDHFWSEGEIEFTDTLEAGDKVLVLAIQGGQSFYIAERVVTYGSDA